MNLSCKLSPGKKKQITLVLIDARHSIYEHRSKHETVYSNLLKQFIVYLNECTHYVFCFFHKDLAKSQRLVAQFREYCSKNQLSEYREDQILVCDKKAVNLHVINRIKDFMKNESTITPFDIQRRRGNDMLVMKTLESLGNKNQSIILITHDPITFKFANILSEILRDAQFKYFSLALVLFSSYFQSQTKKQLIEEHFYRYNFKSAKLSNCYFDHISVLNQIIPYLGKGFAILKNKYFTTVGYYFYPKKLYDLVLKEILNSTVVLRMIPIDFRFQNNEQSQHLNVNQSQAMQNQVLFQKILDLNKTKEIKFSPKEVETMKQNYDRLITQIKILNIDPIHTIPIIGERQKFSEKFHKVINSSRFRQFLKNNRINLQFKIPRQFILAKDQESNGKIFEKFNFPIIVKTLEACFTPNCHIMSIVVSEQGFEELKKDKNFKQVGTLLRLLKRESTYSGDHQPRPVDLQGVLHREAGDSSEAEVDPERLGGKLQGGEGVPRFRLLKEPFRGGEEVPEEDGGQQPGEGGAGARGGPAEVHSGAFGDDFRGVRSEALRVRRDRRLAAKGVLLDRYQPLSGVQECCADQGDVRLAFPGINQLSGDLTIKFYMVKKTKSKARLDKYYQLAKDQGYRSRAAFKLIQLNRKYNFLSEASVLVDLCAAPGGWLQVASSVMPMHSTIIGLDLISIRPIPGCRTFQQDITTPQCVQLLKKELKAGKADVFLHDGAPNVGASWTKDAYNQNELVLISLKLAAQFLRKGGTFVTKVFRSADYNSLIWVFNKFFGKVEATKPTASRFVSAEIFVVCFDFFAPEYIDEKLFDTQHIFKDTEADLATVQMEKEINSVDKLLQKRRRRTGYSEDAPLTLYKPISLRGFCEKDNPYTVFVENNKIDIQNDADLMQLVKPPKDYEYLIDDIKVLGKKEIIQLLKWRSKINTMLRKKQKDEREEGEEEGEGEGEGEEGEGEGEGEEIQDEEEEDEEDDEVEWEDEKKVEEQLLQEQEDELDEQELKEQKEELKEQRKRREKKQQAQRKLQGVDTFGGMEDDQELFDLRKHKKIEELGYEEVEDEAKKGEKRAIAKYEHLGQLEENLEVMYEMRVKKKRENQEKEQKAKQEKDKKRKLPQEEYEENNVACEPTVGKKMKLLEKKFYQNELFEKLKGRLAEGADEKFENPLKVRQKAREEKEKRESEDEDESVAEERKTKASKVQRQVQHELDGMQDIEQDAFPDEDRKVKLYELNVPKSEMQKRRDKLKKKREKEQRKLDRQKEDEYLLNKGEFDVVPEKKLEDYDIDQLATNLVLAKKLLRKNVRDKIIDHSFNRQAALLDHDEELPEWFKDDERKHNFKIDPISKEEFQQEKERLMAINARVPKKVMEAKIRNMKQQQKRMKRASRKAQQVLDQDGLDDRVKMKEVEKIYKKTKVEQSKAKEKKYIVAKKGTASKGKSNRFTKVVDSRLKKDKRAEKRQKETGIRHKIKKRQKKHVKRRKARKQKS